MEQTKRFLSCNEGVIVRPHGKPRTAFSVVPDSILFDSVLSGRARLVLVYIAGRPPGWVTTVSDIQRRLGLTVSQWKLTRDELRKHGIVRPDHPKRSGGGINKFTWVMDVMLEKYYLSTAHPSETADGRHRLFSIDGKRTDYQQECTNSKKPPTGDLTGDPTENGALRRPVVAVPDSVVQEEDARAAPPEFSGLTRAESKRVRAALACASSEQTSLFVKTWEIKRRTARSPAGLAVALARKAAQNQLFSSMKTEALSDPETPVQNEHAFKAGQVCAEHAGQLGCLYGATGVVASCVSASSQGLLHAPQSCGSGIFTVQQSASLWSRYERGELDFKPTE